MIVNRIDNYEDRLIKLLEFNAGSDLFELIQPDSQAENKTEQQAEKGLFSSFKRWWWIKDEGKPSPDYICSVLTAKIKEWKKYLEDESWKCLNQPSGLKELRPVARLIFRAQKTELLRIKIKEYGITDEKLAGALDKLDVIIHRILTTQPAVARRPGAPLAFPGAGLGGFRLTAALPMFACFPFSPIAQMTRPADADRQNTSTPTPPSTPEEKAAIPAGRFNSMQKEFKRELELKLLQENFKKMTPQYDSNWQDSLCRSFNSLESLDEIRAVSGILTVPQIIVLIFSHYFYEKGHEKKLPVLIAKLSYTVLRDVLLGLDEADLKILNKVLASLEERDKHILNHNLQDLFKEAIKLCNDKKKAIDFLADQFRFQIAWQNITRSDLRDMQMLWDDINNNWQAIRRLKVLMDNVITCPVRERDLHDLDTEYSLFLSRLSEPSPPRKHGHSHGSGLSISQSEEAGGGVYHIIYGYVFEEAKIDDDFDAMDIFGAWHMTSPRDYFEVGLFPNLSWDEVEALSGDVSIINHIACINLRKLGIRQVYDWKRLKVFNKKMLREFLAMQDVRNKLMDDLRPAEDILEFWGLQKPEDFRDCGLLGLITDEEFIGIKNDPALMKKMVASNVLKLGIENIKDWKKIHVFHKRMLKEYLAAPEICRKLINDEDSAVKIFHVWDLRYPHSLRDIGLLGNISESDFGKIAENDVEIFRLAARNLKVLGINVISDWKRLNIKNREEFEEFLQQPRIQEKIPKDL